MFAHQLGFVVAFGGGIDHAGLIKCVYVVDCLTDRVHCEVLVLEIDNTFQLY